MFENGSYSIGILDAIEQQIISTKIVTWSYNCLLMIIISYSKPYKCVQINSFYWIEIITWNHIIISIR